LTSADLESRLKRLRSEWPVGSIVDDVMSRIGSTIGPIAASGPHSGRRRVAACLVGASLLAGSVLVLTTVVGRTHPLQAAVQDALARARSAHIMITARGEVGAVETAEIWYRRDRGFRAEMPDEVLVDDGRSVRSWRRSGLDEESIVFLRRSTGAAAKIAELLNVSGVLNNWSRDRAADLDENIQGSPCQAAVLNPPKDGRPEPGVPEGARPVNKHPMRLVVLYDADRKLRKLVTQRRVEGRWVSGREIRIDYDVPVDDTRLAADPPAKARVVNADTAFDERHPLERALVRKEIGGLMLAIHEVRPLDRDGGYYVVSSVRAVTSI
jgi:hypothetical protein